MKTEDRGDRAKEGSNIQAYRKKDKKIKKR